MGSPKSMIHDPEDRELVRASDRQRWWQRMMAVALERAASRRVFDLGLTRARSIRDSSPVDLDRRLGLHKFRSNVAAIKVTLFRRYVRPRVSILAHVLAAYYYIVINFNDCSAFSFTARRKSSRHCARGSPTNGRYGSHPEISIRLAPQGRSRGPRHGLAISRICALACVIQRGKQRARKGLRVPAHDLCEVTLDYRRYFDRYGTHVSYTLLQSL